MPTDLCQGILMPKFFKALVPIWLLMYDHSLIVDFYFFVCFV